MYIHVLYTAHETTRRGLFSFSLCMTIQMDKCLFCAKGRTTKQVLEGDNTIRPSLTQSFFFKNKIKNISWSSELLRCHDTILGAWKSAKMIPFVPPPASSHQNSYL